RRTPDRCHHGFASQLVTGAEDFAVDEDRPTTKKKKRRHTHTQKDHK
ncbi:hypothetical protein GWI33_012244, partial [Rhynchophorus ferrugineus]